MYSQHTSDFKKLVENVKPTDSIDILIKNKSGLIKEKGQNKIYSCNGFEYSFITGKYYVYFENGQLSQESEYDNFGTFVYGKKFDQNGRLRSELITWKIDTKTTDFCEFIKDGNQLTVTMIEKIYRYSKKAEINYLHKEINLIDGKKVSIKKFNEPTTNPN